METTQTTGARPRLLNPREAHAIAAHVAVAPLALAAVVHLGGAAADPLAVGHLAAETHAVAALCGGRRVGGGESGGV